MNKKKNLFIVFLDIFILYMTNSIFINPNYFKRVIEFLVDLIL